MAEPLLKIENLSVDFKGADRVVHAVKQVSLEVNRDETMALVGESGSGMFLPIKNMIEDLGGNNEYPNKRNCKNLAEDPDGIFCAP